LIFLFSALKLLEFCRVSLGVQFFLPDTKPSIAKSRGNRQLSPALYCKNRKSSREISRIDDNDRTQCRLYYRNKYRMKAVLVCLSARLFWRPDDIWRAEAAFPNFFHMKRTVQPLRSTRHNNLSRIFPLCVHVYKVCL